MTKKQKIEIHQDDELAQIDEELDFALEQLESANSTVGGLLGDIEAENKKADPDAAESANAEAENDAKSTESTASSGS